MKSSALPSARGRWLCRWCHLSELADRPGAITAGAGQHGKAPLVVALLDELLIGGRPCVADAAAIRTRERRWLVSRDVSAEFPDGRSHQAARSVSARTESATGYSRW
jgi:hypothetical protein